MFEVESPPWDIEKKYKPESLEVYFEDASSEKLCLVKNNKCLKDVLSDSRYLGRPTWTQFHCKNALYSCACKV